MTRPHQKHIAEVEALIASLQNDADSDKARSASEDPFANLNQDQRDAIDLDGVQSRFKALIGGLKTVRPASDGHIDDVDADLWLLFEAHSSLRSANAPLAGAETYSVIDKVKRIRITMSRASGLAWNLRLESATPGAVSIRIRWQSGAEQALEASVSRGVTRMDVEAASPDDGPEAVRIL